MGCPRALGRPQAAERWPAVRADLLAGRIGIRAAARRLGVGAATVYRLLAAEREAFRNGGAAEGPEMALPADPR